MNKQIKFLLLAFMVISIFTLINCNNTAEDKGAETTEEAHADENGDVTALNVRVVRKTRGDDEIETGDCSGNSSCYEVIGTDNDQIVEVQFCTLNSSTSAEAANIVFVINQTHSVSINIPSVPVGKSSTPYTTNTTNISGPITSVTVNINSEGATPINHCTN